MYKVACSRKEASCIIGSLLVELAPVCEKCGGLPDGVLNLQTEAGLSLTGDADVLITGHSIISGKPVRILISIAVPFIDSVTPCSRPFMFSHKTSMACSKAFCSIFILPFWFHIKEP